MTNIQAVSFGNHQKHKGPTVGGTIGMATMGAVAGSGAYVAKNFSMVKDIVSLHHEAKKAGGAAGDAASLMTSPLVKQIGKKCLKFAGIGAAISAGTYVIIKIISGALNKN